MAENVRCQSVLDKGFLKHVTSGGYALKIAIALALGLILIFFGVRADNDKGAEEVGIEQRIASACSGVEGVGECEVFVYPSPSGTEESVVSVIVICEGGDSVDVRYKLTEMLSSFLGIGANRIKVEKKR